MKQDEIKQLLILLENFDKGGEKEADALDAFLESKGLSYEDALQYATASSEERPETPVEERQLRKDKAADDRKASRDVIDVNQIAKAFGVDLESAMKNGEIEEGDLSEYLRKRGVFSRVKGESNEDYLDRMRNGFDNLNLNFGSLDDKRLVAGSIEHAGLMDTRSGIKKELGSGVSGFLTRLVAPRAFEQAERDIMKGEGAATYTDYVKENSKDLALDLAENLAMTLEAPVSGPLKAVEGAVTASKLYKDFKKGKKILDKRTKANKALSSTKSAAGAVADAAAVPFAFEGLDALVYDDPENPRSEFDLGDALTASAVNLVAPKFIERRGSRAATQTGENAGKFTKAGEDLAKVVPVGKLKKYVQPYAVNKAGRSEMVKQLPFVSSIAEEGEKNKAKKEREAMSMAEKYNKWKNGWAIPMPGDADFEEYQAWLEKNRRGLAKYR